MKKMLIQIFLIIMISSGCKQQIKKESLLPEKEGIKSLQLLQKKTKNEIIGLWKLYKTMYSDGGSLIEEGNEYLNLKENNIFEERNYKGEWVLSFGIPDSTQSEISTFIIKFSQSGTSTPDVSTHLISKKEEDGTIYLITHDLSRGRTKYYIKQQ
jgi:hypothetical protein